MITVKSGTVSITARLDICSVAACAAYLQAQGEVLTTKSDLIWRVVELFKASVERKMEVPTRADDALHLLESLGISVTGNDRQRRQVGRALQEQNSQEDFGHSTTPNSRVTKTNLTQEDKYQLMCTARELLHKPVISREEYFSSIAPQTTQIEERLRASDVVQQHNYGAVESMQVPDAPPEMSEQVREAAERTTQELRALGSMIPKAVVTSKQSTGEQSEPVCAANSVDNSEPVVANTSINNGEDA